THGGRRRAPVHRRDVCHAGRGRARPDRPELPRRRHPDGRGATRGARRRLGPGIGAHGLGHNRDGSGPRRQLRPDRPAGARLAARPATQGGPRMTDVAAPDLEQTLEQHRGELTGHCYRMLGSSFEAEDAVQETMVRAWRGFDNFEGRAALRSWLYRSATNVCLDMWQGRQRRALPMALVSASSGDSEAGPRLPESKWIQPIPDGRALPAIVDPADVAESRESIRGAVLAAPPQLPAPPPGP